MGAYAFVGAAGASLGVLLGGVLTDAGLTHPGPPPSALLPPLGWRWIFLVNVPIGVVAVLATLRAVPADGPRRAGRLDLPGGALVTAGLVAGVLAIVDAPARALAAPAAVVLLGAFVLRQRTAAEPLVRLVMFRSRAVSGGNVVQLLVVPGVGAGLVLPAVTTVIMSEASGSDAGLASGLANTTLQVGGALGVALAAVLAAARTDGLLAAGVPAADALAAGYRAAFAGGAVTVTVAVVLTLTVLRPRRPARV